MNDEYDEFYLDLNPEPWAVGKAYALRGGRGANVSPNKKLVAYQEAVREAMLALKPSQTEGPVVLRFFFMRAIEKLTYGNKKAQANYADATNLQKALEDALQGILYKNDQQVVDIQSVIFGQGPDIKPGILIYINRSPLATDATYERELNRLIEFGKVNEPENNKW